jgi:6,7-dimethyl-8-ribityllumazine synthase
MSANTRRVAIVAADFNLGIVNHMIKAAAEEAAQAGVEVAELLRVPGSYETPLAAELLLARDDIAAVVVLGYIEKGETQHGFVMGQVVHGMLLRLQLKHRKPIGLGIIGPGATEAQAEVRKDRTARAAVRAALRLLELF